MKNDGVSTTHEWSNNERLLITIMAVLLVLHAAVHAWNIFFPAEQIKWTIAVPLFTVFSFVNGLYTLGWRRTVVFFGVACVIAWGAEAYGLRNEWFFGSYYYTDLLGWKILGVPWTVPLAYFMMLYPSYIITNIIIDGHAVSLPLSSLWRVPAISLLTALIMAAWDLTNDPLMSDLVKAWIWRDGGPFFGIPLQNFAGWVTVLFVITLIYRISERHIPKRPLGRSSRVVVGAALFGYFLFLLTDAVAGYPLGTRVISPFAMGIPLLAAMIRLADRRDSVERLAAEMSMASHNQEAR